MMCVARLATERRLLPRTLATLNLEVKRGFLDFETF